MKKMILAIAIGVSTLLSANTIGSVEYDLPETAQNWSVLHQEEGSKNLLIGSITQEGTEFFGAVHVAQGGPLPANLADLERDLQIPFPDQTIKANLLSTTADSVLYEWSANDDNQEVIHGWGRIFMTPDETVSLNYTTGQLGKVNAARELWLPVLQNAHKLDNN